jgi:hypothetical protein
MTYRPCDHCGRNYGRSADTDPHEPDYYLCPECADMSVWAAACSECDRIPTATRPCTSRASAD